MQERAADQSHRDRPIGLGVALLAIFCSILWGGTVPAIRYSVDSLPPVGTAAMRFALATLFMLVWCKWQGTPLRVRPGQWTPILVLGTILAVQISVLNWATERTSASHGSLFLNVYPVFVALLAHFFLVGDRMTARMSAGLILAMVGVALVLFLGQEEDPGARDQPGLFGNLLALTSAFLLGLKTVCIKRFLPRIEVNKLLFWHHLYAVMLFSITSAIVEGPERYEFTTPAVLGVLYQGLVVAGFCFAAWYWLLRTHRASQLSVFAFVTPLAGVIFSHLLRGDSVGKAILLGGLAILGGIYLVSAPGRAKAVENSAGGPSGNVG